MIKKFSEGLYPLTKLYFAISLIISAFLIPNDFYGYVLVIVCGILASFYGKGSAYFKRVFISLFLLTLVIFAAQSTLFASNEIVAKIGIFTIYKAGLLKAVKNYIKVMGNRGFSYIADSYNFNKGFYSSS